MPVYDYLCTACDHRADILHGINDPGPNFCPSCGAEGTMRKQFAAPAIHFKGTGWAKKDRGSSTSTRAAAKAQGDAAKDGAKDGGEGGAKRDGESGAKDASSSESASTSSTAPKPNTTD
jgi:putative FmdB family regulatory protein